MRQTYRRISFCAFHVMRTILRPNADIDYWMLHAAQYAALLTPYHVRLTAFTECALSSYGLVGECWASQAQRQPTLARLTALTLFL